MSHLRLQITQNGCEYLLPSVQAIICAKGFIFMLDKSDGLLLFSPLYKCTVLPLLEEVLEKKTHDLLGIVSLKKLKKPKQLVTM